MWRTLLTLVALVSQAFSLVGPGVVVCRDRGGRVGFEFVGQPCTHCRPDAPAACGCCQHHDDAPPPCDCEHTPLVALDDAPAVLTAPAAVEPPALVAAPWAMVDLTPLPGRGQSVGHHDPPRSARSAHLPLLAGVVIRC